MTRAERTTGSLAATGREALAVQDRAAKPAAAAAPAPSTMATALKGTLPRNWAYGTRMDNRPSKVYNVQKTT